MPDPLPTRPIDRVRALLLPHGRPSLTKTRRASARSAVAVAEALAQLRTALVLGERAWTTLDALVWSWHDHHDESHARVQSIEGHLDADAVHLILHRREGDADNARYWLGTIGYHPAWDRLLPVAAAEGLSGPLCNGPHFRPDAFLGRCLRPPTGEIPALERLQAAELLALAAAVVEPVHGGGPMGGPRTP